MKKKNEIGITNPASKELDNFKSAQEMYKALLETKHYSKMNQGEMFGIICMANSLGINPITALNGGLYPVHGKVEMNARMMGMLIRKAGHSLTTSKHDDTICTIHGKRKDNGDQGSASFSIKEAQRAGIIKPGGPWTKWPQDMLYARALSRLARRLFPDVIGDCYVEGEIRESIDTSSVTGTTPVTEIENCIDCESVSHGNELEEILNQVPEYKSKVDEFMAKRNISCYEELPESTYEKMLNNAKAYLEPHVMEA